MNKKNRIPIFPVLFKSDDINQLYESFEYFNLKVYNEAIDYNSKNKTFYSYRLIPEYFKLNLRDASFKTKIIPQYNWGYSILLNPSDTIGSYMQRQFNSKKRNIYTRYVRRLETCFDIKYKMFYGDISKTDYNFIMQALYDMIIERFEERNELHKNLHEWNYLLENTYSEIINNNASLFVIYNKDEPIEISLNYHFDKVLFSYLSSYDINYSKFGLGHVEIYKQIEWCTNHGYILFEMGVGGMDYKRRWSNNVYRYNHIILYKKTCNTISFKVHIYIKKILIKEFLKSKKINEIIPIINMFFRRNKNNKNNVIIESFELNDTFMFETHKKIDHNSKNYSFLKKYICSFIYNSKDHYSDIIVLKNTTNNAFLIKGKNKFQSISFVR
ncbi:GNAT family N-acetyltransferase [Flavivirga algicola]|uniref:GNAT family N-acetyltransferase n=1 Tax=Flavivirga algicola TaxID=2729136 RepID=A0ABX1S1B0_9FLAO|nr:GNAT family N-acetyltransferase [Flavivirga algicola]NMH88219.1 GNAT family N-acetyltransferase [Flavivirga algicola]